MAKQRYKATVALPFDAQVIQGSKIEGFAVQHVVRDVLREQTTVVIEGPVLPSWTPGSVPYHFNSLERLADYLQGKPTVFRGR